ncbi:MAG: hypothetical protein ABR562_00765 [Thermoplasmatota archaeon]|nr:hypothetical protein [Halobacteriales archaeon]
MKARRLVAVALLAVLLSGCGSGGGQTTTPQAAGHAVAFAQRPSGERDGDHITWYFQLVNGAATSATGLSLHLSIAFNNDRQPANTAERPLPSLAPGQLAEYTLATPYRGLGDYSGPVEVWQGGQEVAREFVYFEDCGNC